MPRWVALGRNAYDYGLMVDFHKHRAMVRANTAWIEGIALEKIAPGLSGYEKGIVLIHRDWKNLYFMNERDRWDETDYFDFAKRKFMERGITKP